MVTNSIVTVATVKGGSGKSTLASCLAAHWHLNGRRPAIIDADPQRSLARLAAREKKLGGIHVVEDCTEQAGATAHRLASTFDVVIVDTPGFHSQATLGCLRETDLVLIPVKPSPFDVDCMLDTLAILKNGTRGRQLIFRCVMSQTNRDSVISRHIRSEISGAGFPVLANEVTNRVAYPEAALWGATPSMIDRAGPAARDIAALANEVDHILGAMPQLKQAANA